MIAILPQRTEAMGFPCEHITADRLVHCSVAISVVETVLDGVKAALVTWKQILHTIQSCSGTASTSVTAFHYSWGVWFLSLTLEKWSSCSVKCSYRRAASDSVPQGAVDCDPHQAQISRMGFISSSRSAEHSQQHPWVQGKQWPLTGSGPGCSAPKEMSL